MVAPALTWALALSGATAIAVALTDRVAPPPQPADAAPADPAAATSWLPPDAAASPAPTSDARPDQDALPDQSVALPTRIRIPDIGVDAAVEQIGLNPDRTVAVPTDPSDAGWYRYSVPPGQLGPAVILGHVDAARIGPAVFYGLGGLARGDRIEVTRSDGTVATFVVTTVTEFAKAAFPTAAVYGPTNQPALRLITCGDWDASAHAYRGNTVVFADEQSPPDSPGPAAADSA
ncbi:MAG TPA: class F sortase [Sporichthyaceae bacterium]|jgi:sortase (surface protein transpeptidase)|nr:class F sortase [Sporichthyaceae bacterium]